MLGTMAHAYNLSCLGNRDQVGSLFRPAWVKKLSRTPSQPKAARGGACLLSQLCGRYK
jgi:hypothetical protein